MRAASSTVVACAFACALGCHAKATREECTQAMDRYIDLVIAEDPSIAKLPAPQASAVREMKRELKLGVASYKKVHDRCAEVARGDVRCAIASSKSDEWEECIR